MYNCTNFCVHNISKMNCSVVKYEFRFATVVLNSIIPFKYVLTENFQKAVHSNYTKYMPTEVVGEHPHGFDRSGNFRIRNKRLTADAVYDTEGDVCVCLFGGGRG